MDGFENPTFTYTTFKNDQYLMVTVKVNGKSQKFWALNSNDLEMFLKM